MGCKKISLAFSGNGNHKKYQRKYLNLRSKMDKSEKIKNIAIGKKTTKSKKLKKWKKREKNGKSEKLEKKTKCTKLKKKKYWRIW